MLDFDLIEWDDANEGHITAHDVTPAEVDEVLLSPDPVEGYGQKGRLAATNWTRGGRYIRVVYERRVDHGLVTLRPVTAYEVDPP
jgi:hypothetical protein